HRWFIFSCGWTRSQLLLLLIFNLFWIGVSGWACHRYNVACDATIYWQQQYINVSFTSMVHSNAIPK
ncbi:MAG: hypothetical protein WCG75_05710, partial [Armatimonadota bacterium]